MIDRAGTSTASRLWASKDSEVGLGSHYSCRYRRHYRLFDSETCLVRENLTARRRASIVLAYGDAWLT